MSFFSVEYDVAPAVELLREIRSKVAAIREPIFEAVHGPIRDAVLSDVDDLIAPAPGPAVHEFEFATVASRNWYFWAKRTGKIPGQSWDRADGGWERTERLETSWNVTVNVSANEAFMTIENDAVDYKGDNYAQAVYGPDAVPGHEITGWGETIDDGLEKISESLDQLLGEALDEALAEFGL